MVHVQNTQGKKASEGESIRIQPNKSSGRSNRSEEEVSIQLILQLFAFLLHVRLKCVRRINHTYETICTWPTTQTFHSPMSWSVR